MFSAEVHQECVLDEITSKVIKSGAFYMQLFFVMRLLKASNQHQWFRL